MPRRGPGFLLSPIPSSAKSLAGEQVASQWTEPAAAGAAPNMTSCESVLVVAL